MNVYNQSSGKSPPPSMLPFDDLTQGNSADIQIIIAGILSCLPWTTPSNIPLCCWFMYSLVSKGNPRGLISAHHEKLVLIDSECLDHSFAFAGGFDICRGRYDSSAHLVPTSYNQRKLKKEGQRVAVSETSSSNFCRPPIWFVLVLL